MKRLINTLYILVYCQLLSGQHTAIVIQNILFEGNNHTKPNTILRELDFEVGDTIHISELDDIFHRNKVNILSTGLFNDSEINLKNYNSEGMVSDILIRLEENWYLFPVPIFELADRNFSVWWQEQNKSLSRVNYGFRVSHYNLTGNRDPIKFKVHFGYTNKYEINYDYPYLAMNNRLGFGINLFYSENKEIGYKTENNKTLFATHEDEIDLLSRLRIGPEIKYRPNPYHFHGLRFEFHHNKVNPYVVDELNDSYFLDGRMGIRFFLIEYDYNFDKRHYRHYPQGGFLIFANIKKEGIGIYGEFDNLSVTAGFEKHFSANQRLTISTRNKGKTNLIRKKVSFANNTGLGWNADIVSGYELYVMDGTDYFINMNSVKWRLYDSNMDMAKWLPSQFRKMNLTVFLRGNLDFAYVYEPEYIESNTLNNRWIYGYGPAIDFILFNNFLFSFEYSVNDKGEKGLFFHNAIAF
ncbi:MAG: hypothetical protein HKN67_05705 [Saprospiraceae bacterium]|nr:hypothetical protein [Saprospiraceae bacterium]